MASHLAYVAKQENIKFEPDGLHVIAEKADGALRDALSIFDQIVNYCDGNITYDAVIQNLNILDYDYYFKITDHLLKNEIHQSLLVFNEILENGFDGHNFINGLGSHLRNLLVSNDAITLRLLEVSDNVKAKYNEQSKSANLKFLIDGLKIIGETDVQYKSSKNQRLHVELALMKLSSLTAIEGEKKK